MKCRRSSLLLGLVLAGSFVAPLARAQQQSSDELQKDIQAIKETQKAMQKDLQEIKTLLQSRLGAPAAPPSANVVLDLGKNPFKGARTAPLTLVEFSDYQWPFCGRHVRETSPQIEKEYVATGKLKYVFIDFPLESIHKSAFKASEATHCAGEQGKFWEMHDRLFENQKSLEPWTPHAQAIGLDVPKFEACMSSGKYADEIRKNLADGEKAGVSGTPLFFLAYTDPGSSKVKTVSRLSGAQPFAAFKAQIDQLLATPPKPDKGKAAEKPH